MKILFTLALLLPAIASATNIFEPAGDKINIFSDPVNKYDVTLPVGAPTEADYSSLCYFQVAPNDELTNFHQEIKNASTAIDSTCSVYTPREKWINVGGGPYKENDSTSSKYECRKVRVNAYYADYAGLHSDKIIKLANNPDGGSQELCFIKSMHYWATENALSSVSWISPDSKYTDYGYVTSMDIPFSMVAIATSFLRHTHARDLARAMPWGASNKEQDIINWLTVVGTRMNTDLVRLLNRTNYADDLYSDNYFRNTTLYRAQALMAISYLTNNTTWRNNSRAVFTAVYNTISSDGYLVKELERGKKSQHYTAFALYPLMMMGALSKKEGAPLLDTSAKRAKFALVLTKSVIAHYDDSKEITEKVNALTGSNYLNTDMQDENPEAILHLARIAYPAIYDHVMAKLETLTTTSNQKGRIGTSELAQLKTRMAECESQTTPIDDCKFSSPYTGGDFHRLADYLNSSQ